MPKVPEFEHYCDGCQYLGSGTYRGKPHDWYKCGKGEHWTIVARFGDAVDEYCSGSFLSCVEVTHLEVRALALGLELEDRDKDKLIKRLLYEKRGKCTREDHGNYFADEEACALGDGDWIESTE